MDTTSTGASLRPSILSMLPSLHGHITTREVATRIGASNTAAFRELGQLEAEGVVERRFGSSGIAGVGWRFVAMPAPVVPL